MLFYITGGAPQAVPGTACVEANRTACIEDTCSSVQNSKNKVTNGLVGGRLVDRRLGLGGWVQRGWER
jgi:hypothetical protein